MSTHFRSLITVPIIVDSSTRPNRNMFLLAIIIILISFLLILKSKKHHSLDVFPVPPSNFFLGHVQKADSTAKILKVLSDYINNYGRNVKLLVGPPFAPIRTVILTADYQLIQLLLSKNHVMTKSENYIYLKPWLGNGLLLSEGSYWRKHRKILTPAFHFEILKEFVETFESVGNVLVDKLKKSDRVDSVDLHPIVTLCTLDVICETAMGTKINAQNGENSQYVNSVKEMCRIVIGRCLSPFKLFNSTYWMTRDYYIQNRVLTVLHNFTSTVINSKKLRETDTTMKKMAFLDLLLKFSQDGDVLNDEEIREEVDTFMFEGHDTTAAGICFTLYCLAEHPDIQEKVLQEQKDLFGNEKDPVVTYSELQNMNYLEHVIKETFRLYPPVPALGRFTTEDIEFEGIRIPKHTNIVIFIYSLHRDPEYFPEPEKFNPQRFQTFDGSLPYAYIPFSAGSRNCIGQKFAMLEMKSIISKIIRHFEIRAAIPRHDLMLSLEAVLKSANGIRVGLQKRD